MNLSKIKTLLIDDEKAPLSDDILKPFIIHSAWKIGADLSALDSIISDIDLFIINKVTFEAYSDLRSFIGQKSVDTLIIDSISQNTYILNDFNIKIPEKTFDSISSVASSIFKRKEIKKILHKSETDISNSDLYVPWITVFKGKTKIIVLHKDIEYIEAKEKFCIIYTDHGLKYMHYQLLKDVLEMLPQDSFFRSHKSFVVNLFKIVEFDKQKEIIMSSGAIIPLARRRRLLLRI